MNETQPKPTESNSNNSLGALQFAAVLFRYKAFIIVLTLIGLIASVIISLMIPKWYVATVNCIPPKRTQGSLFEGLGSGVSSTLKEFGLTKLGGSSSDGYSFLVVLYSRTIQDSLIKKFNLAKEYDIPDTSQEDILKELSSNMTITYEKEGNYTITVLDKNPKRAAEMANYTVELANSLAQQIFKFEATNSRKYLEKRLFTIDSTLIVLSNSLKRFSSSTMLFSPTDQAKALSSAYADLKANVISQETIYELYCNRYGKDDQSTKMQMQLINNLKSKLKDIETKPGFAGNFALKDAGKIGIDYMQLSTEMETFSKVKAILMPMLEDARLEENRATQSLIILDQAVPPTKKTLPKRSFIVLGATVGSFIIAIMLILLFNAYRNFRTQYKKYYTSMTNQENESN